MKEQNLLNLDDFFFSVKRIPYVIVKLDTHFPHYVQAEDIDIFCYSKSQFVQKILAVGNTYLNEKTEIKVTDINEEQSHIDFLFENTLDFRFDVYQKLPLFHKIKIKDQYIYSVIENAVSIKHYFNGKPYHLYVPSEIDELLIRYIEYVEYYEQRPDKIKHLDYIKKTIKSNPERINFFDKLHLYTDLPDSFPKPNLIQKIAQSVLKKFEKLI